MYLFENFYFFFFLYRLLYLITDPASRREKFQYGCHYLERFSKRNITVYRMNLFYLYFIIRSLLFYYFKVYLYFYNEHSLNMNILFQIIIRKYTF